MSSPIMNVELCEEDEARALLARMFYLHHNEYRKKPVSPPPFAPEWAYDYARIAIDYLSVDADGIDALREDYK